MIEAQISSATGPRPVRVQIRLRDREVLEGEFQVVAGQALAPFLVKGKGSVLLWRAVGGSGEKLDQRSVRLAEIAWVRPLEAGLPLVHLTAIEMDSCQVEVTVAGGDVLAGQVNMMKGQKVTELLSSSGQFVPLWRARSLANGERLGDIVVNQEVIQSIRDSAAPEVSPVPAVLDAGPKLHWLVKLARQLELPGAQTIILKPSSSIGQVWGLICIAAGIDQEDLAGIVAKQLRMPLANAIDLASAEAFPSFEALSERYAVRVVNDDGRMLRVATADPMDADAEQALAFASKRRVVFEIASPRALGLSSEAGPDHEPDVEALLAGMGGGADSVRVEDELEPQEIDLHDVRSEPIIKLASVILREAVRLGASDIHLEPDQSRGIVRFRVDGMLRPYMHIPLAALNRVISRYKVIARLDIADRVRPQDGRVRIRVDGRRYELRLSTVPTQDAEKAVMRIAGSVQEQTLDQLDISAPELGVLEQLLSHRDGIIVVTGPTGSGKTTTLYAALHQLNNGKINIMTVEDPIERALAGTTQIQVQPKAGVTFASALRAILRQDPDVILVGEIRDLETAEIAVQAAMTGHLVLTTLHTTSAVGVVTRLRDLGLEGSSLAASLRGIVSQRLARRTCTDCRGKGCGSCEGSGFRGRIPIMEVVSANPGFTEMVGRGASFHELQRAALANGMRPIREVAEDRVAAGDTTYEEIQRVLGAVEEEARVHTASQQLALPAGSNVEYDEFTGEPITPAIDAHANGNNLPMRQIGWGGQQTDHDSPAYRRAEAARGLLQGLDRCIAEGQGVGEVMHFACQQLSVAFDSPLVWVSTLEDGAFRMRARAGACAPYVRDIVAQWDDVAEGDGAVATALRTGEPQARHLDKEPGFDSWREYARAYGLPIFLAIPMEGRSGPLGVVGVHVRGVDGLDHHAGNELVSLVARLTGALERLRELESVKMQLSALESAADAVFTTDRRGVIQWVNRAFIQLTGYAAGEAIGQSAALLRSDRHDAAFFHSLWDTVLGGRPWRGELHNRRKDGGVVVVETTITPVASENGEINHFLAVQRDISERKLREESVQSLVNKDPATGLPNARTLDLELERAVGEAANDGREYALLLVHLNGAATVRDSVGHAEADQMVAAVAEVLQNALRPGDYLARLGDDEFAALLPDTPPEGVLIAADRLCAKVNSHPYDLPDLPAAPTISIGIAPVDGSQSPRAILAMADSALYGTRGRTESVVLSKPADAQGGDGEAADGWGERIKDALESDLFFLHFQPVVRLEDRTVSHFDALIRLHDENGEVIPARAFISHAERLGLMPQLDRWVVENVLRLLNMSPGLRVSLNLSPATLTSAPFRQFLQRRTRSLSAVAGRLIFEVGEIENTLELGRAQESMARLTPIGCSFALDNFGITGSSLASLGNLPVDYVKLDGSLIRNIDRDESAREVVQALATVARALGKEVIAGWAESESIVDLLPQLGIGMAQGNHLGRPSRELKAAVGDVVTLEDVAASSVAAESDSNGNGRRKRR